MAKTPNQTRIVEAAQRLFARNGFHGVSLDRVIEESGVSRMTLYKRFPTKSDLIAETLADREAKYFAALSEKLKESPNDPKSQILMLFDFAEAWADDPGFNGCFFVNALAQFGDAKSSEAKMVRRHKKKMLRLTEQICTELGVSDPKALSLDIRLLLEGANVSKLTLGDTLAFRRARRIALTIISNSLTDES